VSVLRGKITQLTQGGALPAALVGFVDRATAALAAIGTAAIERRAAALADLDR
jgi:hypothetical protein